MWNRISADPDKEFESDGSPNRRNLSFRSDNIEIAAIGVFQITPSSPRARTDWTTYIMGGVGAAFFNPKAELNGNYEELQPLQTEGEDYGKVALVLPAGAGINYRASYEWSFGLEASYRFTTTDYLDDVSTTYIDNASFTDPIARQLADRGPEIGAPLREAGDQRGDPDNNDGYFLVQAKVYYHFNQGMYYKRKKRRPSKVFRR
jgi:opacity protein-like surface antigen